MERVNLSSIQFVKEAKEIFFWYLGQVGDVAGTDGVTAA
jgi:hypothetical protein